MIHVLKSAVLTLVFLSSLALLGTYNLAQGEAYPLLDMTAESQIQGDGQDSLPLPSLALRDIAMSDPTDPYVREVFAIERIQADLAAQSRAAAAPTSVSASDFGPQPLRQWSRIVVQAISDNGWDIFSLRMDGSDVRRLTVHPAADVRPQLHAGLGLVVFTSVRDGNAEIYTVPVDGSAAPKRLTFHDAPDDWPAWSDDGRIAFASGRDRQYDIYVMAADGSGQTRLDYDPYAHDVMPIWSGNTLYWVHYTASGQASIWTNEGWRQALFQGELAQLENLRLGVAGLIFDADFDRDGWNELGQIIRGGTGYVPVMIYDPGGSQDIMPGPSHPIQDPTESDPSILINRAVYANVNGEPVLSDFKVERVRLGTGLQFHTFEPVAPWALVGSWVNDDHQGPILQFATYPTYPIFVHNRPVTLGLSGYDPGGSGIIGMHLQTDQYGSWLEPNGGVAPLTGPEFTLAELTPREDGELNMRVRGIDHVGNVGPWSAPIYFTTYIGHIDLQIMDVMGRPVPNAQVYRDRWQLVGDRTDATGSIQGLIMASPRVDDVMTITHPGYAIPPYFIGLSERDFNTATDMKRMYVSPVDTVFRQGPITNDTWQSDWSRVVGAVNAPGYWGSLRLGDLNQPQNMAEISVAKNIDLANFHHPMLNLSLQAYIRDDTFRIQIKSQQVVTDLLIFDSVGITSTAVFHDQIQEYSSDTSGNPVYTFDLTPWASQKVTLILALTSEDDWIRDVAYVDNISLGSWTTPVIDSALISQSGSITHVLELGQSATITVTGQNFLGTPTVRLGQTALASVTVTGESHLIATIPANLGPGIHTLWITNPDKTLTALPNTAIVGNQIYLPLLSRCTEDPVMCR